MQAVGNAAEGAAAPRCYVNFEYICKFCFRTFKSGHALGGHQNIHRNDENREVGKYCGVSFGFENRSQRKVAATDQKTKRGPRVQHLRVGDGSSSGLNHQGGSSAPGLHPGVGVGLVAQDSILAMARPRLNNQGPPPPIAPTLSPVSIGSETGAIYYAETIPGSRFNQGPQSARQVHPGLGDENPRIGVGSGGLRSTWAMPRAGLNVQGAHTEPGLDSAVGDNFSNLAAGNGFNLRIEPTGLDENVDLTLDLTPAGAKPVRAPTMEESLKLTIAPPALAPRCYHSYRPPGQAKPPYDGFLEDHFGRWKLNNHPSKRTGSATYSETTVSSGSSGVEVSSRLSDGVDLELKL